VLPTAAGLELLMLSTRREEHSCGRVTHLAMVDSAKLPGQLFALTSHKEV
jgi:hypothetical protein